MHSSCQGSQQVAVIFGNPGLRLPQQLNPPAGVQYGRVIPSTERVADLWEAVGREVLGESHRDLSRSSDGAAATFRMEIRDSHLEVLCNGFLNVVDGD